MSSIHCLNSGIAPAPICDEPAHGGFIIGWDTLHGSGVLRRRWCHMVRRFRVARLVASSGQGHRSGYMHDRCLQAVHASFFGTQVEIRHPSPRRRGAGGEVCPASSKVCPPSAAPNYSASGISGQRRSGRSRPSCGRSSSGLYGSRRFPSAARRGGVSFQAG